MLKESPLPPGPGDSLALIPGREPTWLLPDALSPMWAKTAHSITSFTSLRASWESLSHSVHLKIYSCLHTWEHAG